MEVITDYGTFLREAKSAVQELDRMKEQQERLARQLKQDQKALEAGKKQVEARDVGPYYQHFVKMIDEICRRSYAD